MKSHLREYYPSHPLPVIYFSPPSIRRSARATMRGESLPRHQRLSQSRTGASRGRALGMTQFRRGAGSLSDQIGDIREDIGGLKAAVTALADSVKSMAETSTAGRSRIYEKLETVSIAVADVQVKVDDLKRRVDKIEPFTQELQTRAYQIQGAGQLGRFLWWVGGFDLTAAGALYASWDSLSKIFRQP